MNAYLTWNEGGTSLVLRALSIACSLLFARYYEGELRGHCNVHGGYEKYVQKCWLESLKGRHHPEDLCFYRMIMLKRILGADDGLF
jgi:hypothetical protein